MFMKPIFNPRLSVCLLLFIKLCFLTACSESPGQQTMFIEEEKKLNEIPSASGMVIKDTLTYIVCDDATGIYQLNLRDYRQSKIPIHGLVDTQYRVPKATKHDFESGTLMDWNGKQYLLAFGSGSATVIRDSMLLLNMGDFEDQKIVSIHQFYQKLRQLTNTDSTQWNIEGAAVANAYLFLCNRGTNLIIKIRAGEFMNYVHDTSSVFPNVEYHQVQLPSIEGKQARLSAACALANGDLLLAASVEDTPDWISDGPVLGSYICVFSSKENKATASYLLQDKNGQPLKEKLETVEILDGHSDSKLTLVALSDNDAGISKLFRLRIASK
jgi:hypothetical protein